MRRRSGPPRRWGGLSSPALALSAALALWGCAADLTEAWEVKEPRLMGARIEVDGDPDNPHPQFGQTFAVRQFLALPGPLATPLPQRYSFGLAICIGYKTDTGELICLTEQPLAPVVTPISDTEVLLAGLNLDLTQIDLTSLGITPEQLATLTLDNLPEDLRNIDRLLLFGAWCVEGTVERVPGKTARDDPPSQLYRCVDNPQAAFPDVSTFTLSVLLDWGRPSDRNRNPQFACDPAAPDSACALGVVREGEPQVGGPFVLALPEPQEKGALRQVVPWPAHPDPGSLPWDGCAQDPTLPQILAGSDKLTIRARFDPGDREQFQQQIEQNGEPILRDRREALILSHAISTKGGELDGDESRLDDEEVDARAEISLSYTAPEQGHRPEDQIPENGRLVRFSFTLRDQRGGVDFTTRELCVMPPKAQE